MTSTTDDVYHEAMGSQERFTNVIVVISPCLLEVRPLLGVISRTAVIDPSPLRQAMGSQAHAWAAPQGGAWARLPEGGAAGVRLPFPAPAAEPLAQQPWRGVLRLRVVHLPPAPVRSACTADWEGYSFDSPAICWRTGGGCLGRSRAFCELHVSSAFAGPPACFHCRNERQERGPTSNTQSPKHTHAIW